jgi:hypothetical protein
MTKQCIRTTARHTLVPSMHIEDLLLSNYECTTYTYQRIELVNVGRFLGKMPRLSLILADMTNR